MKINKPKIKNTYDSTFEKMIEEDSFSNINVSCNVTSSIIISNETIDEGIFNNIDFNNVLFESVDLCDVEFNNCDLSNKCFDKQFISRVVFNNCKLVGTTFIESHLKDIEFINCNCRYINLSGSNLNNIKINDSSFDEASFNEVEIKNIEFKSVDFYRTEFTNCKLDKIDFRECNISGTLFDRKSIHGIIVNSFQCRDIVGMLGVSVED